MKMSYRKFKVHELDLKHISIFLGNPLAQQHSLCSDLTWHLSIYNFSGRRITSSVHFTSAKFYDIQYRYSVSISKTPQFITLLRGWQQFALGSTKFHGNKK